MENNRTFVLFSGMVIGVLVGVFAVHPLLFNDPRVEVLRVNADGDYATDAVPAVTTGDAITTPPYAIHGQSVELYRPETPAPVVQARGNINVVMGYQVCNGEWWIIEKAEWERIQAELDECQATKNAPALDAKPGYVLVRKDIWDILEPALKHLAEQEKAKEADK